MEINRHLAEIDQKLSHIHTLIKQADERSFALELVVSWLLSRNPQDETFRFLATQANNMEVSAQNKSRNQEFVAVLDELRELASEWHALNATAQSDQPGMHE